MTTGQLINEIAIPSFPNVFNPWRDRDELDLPGGPFARRHRLMQHFACEPKFVLIGEAPGYQGCHFSGIPFTSERLLVEGKVPRVNCPDRITTRPKPWSEPSATVVWSTLHDLGIAETTVLWNAFAWHPHLPGEPHSNRTPARDELLIGAVVLERVVNHFRDANVVAVGRVSQNILTSAGIKHVGAVRHPSMGGASEFRRGMETLVRAVK